MTHFLNRGPVWHQTTQDPAERHDMLPEGCYYVQYNPITQECFLVEAPGFTVPGKLYGSFEDRADKILTTFAKRNKSMGVLLSGMRGSGKTLLAKLIAVKAAVLGMPTLIINNPLPSEVLNKFLQDMTQKVIVFIDEFEKTHERKDQIPMLGLLDGVFSTTKLFILTCNDVTKVDANMINRPGRIYYYLPFASMEPAAVHEYCEDCLINKKWLSLVEQTVCLFETFNFDMLQALIDEMNRYDYSPQEALTMLNVRPEGGSYIRFDIELFSPTGEKLNCKPDSRMGFPTHEDEHTYYHYIDKVKHEVVFFNTDLYEVDPKECKFSFRNDEGYTLIHTKKKYRGNKLLGFKQETASEYDD